MNANAIALLTAKATLGASLALGLLLAPHGSARADDAYAREETVNLSELPNLDIMPVCALEDGSDQLTGPDSDPCIWTDPDTGNAYWTTFDRSWLIVDDTVVSAY